MSKQKQIAKYKNSELRSIYEAFGFLDGIRTGEQFTPYKFMGNALEAIIKNKIKLRPHIDMTNEMYNRLLINNLPSGTASLPPNTPERLKFNDEWNAFLQKEEGFVFISFSFNDLNLKDNAIPASVIETLIVHGIITGMR